MKYKEYIMERKSCLVAEVFFIEWKLYENLRQRIVSCVVRLEVCWDESPPPTHTHTVRKCTHVCVLSGCRGRDEQKEFGRAFYNASLVMPSSGHSKYYLESKGNDP